MAPPGETASPKGRGASHGAAVGEHVSLVLRPITGAFAAVLPAGNARPGAKDPPEPALPLKPTERFLLGETEFRQLWSSSERVYLVTDSFLDGNGILDQGSTFAVIGQIGNRWVLSNRP
jgi:hypothetical protein